MGYREEISHFTDNDPILVACDECGGERKILLISVKRSIKRNGKYVCQSCRAKAVPKPQNSKGYWTEQKRKDHSLSVANSEAYRCGLEKRKELRGVDNPMFGKKHSLATRRKMSESRKGKVGPNATGWKGGKTSLTCRVKGFTNRELHWYSLCYKRDGFKCQECGCRSQKGNRLDVHHIEPMAKLIKRLLKDTKFQDIEQKYLWLIKQPEIKDVGLKNGITLCRKCHKKVHKNWGSHEPR